MKRIVVIKTSQRPHSNSSCLADAFIRGAREAGHEVEEIQLAHKHIDFCRGCLACQRTGQCVIKDDANAITESMCAADVIVWATPVYYYSVSGQMKTMIDRANPLYAADYRFRDVYLLASAADDAPSAVEGCVKAVEGWVECFSKATFQRTIFAGGVNNPGEAEHHAAYQAAYALGRSLD